MPTSIPRPTPDFFPDVNPEADIDLSIDLMPKPDFAIPMPFDDAPMEDFKEKAEAACRTAKALNLNTDVTEQDRKEAEEALLALAGAMDPVKESKKLAAKDMSPATYNEVRQLIEDYSVRVVDNAMQLRLLVTNKLVLLSANPDAKVQLRALELLGKITDVGLFTEKSEVTITHRSTNDLVNNLRDKIQRLMHPEGVIDAEVIEVNGKAIDIDAELGTKGEIL